MFIVTKKKKQDMLRNRISNPSYKKYSRRENLERIADYLMSIQCTLGAINLHQNQDKRIVEGISAICKNTYANNIRTDEVIKLIKELFPEGLKD